jgi:hypothetical protein
MFTKLGENFREISAIFVNFRENAKTKIALQLCSPESQMEWLPSILIYKY